MNRNLRIAVADDEPRMRDYYQEILPLLGHRVICAAQTGRELVRFCGETRPDLIVSDIKMPDLDGIDAIREIGRSEPIPAILVSAYHDPALIERTKGEQILAYLVKPIKQADLAVAVGLAMQRFEEFQTLRKEAGEMRQALSDRKIIERAKGILMKRSGLDEEGAFRRLQKLSRDHNQKLVDTSRDILRVEEAFQPPDP
jgi:two-component system, response regulator PdtaR